MPRHLRKPNATGASPAPLGDAKPADIRTLPYKSKPVEKPKRPPLFAPLDPKTAARWQGRALVFVGVAALGVSFLGFFTYAAHKRDAEHYAALTIPLDVSDRYQSAAFAQSFDADIDSSEWYTGITKLRKKLLAKARGHVLEASAGTGRNSTFYPLTSGAIKSVTLIDTSADMLRVARVKWAETNAWFVHALFRVQSAADKVSCPAEGGFDTVVQTMGVCSMPDPAAALRNLGDLCRQDDEARILLLEHGRGHYAWVNRWLDRAAPAHADRHGCWHNKDVGEVVRQSGLEIVEQKRYHLGTTWWFELKPPKRKEPEKQKEIVEANQDKDRPWWFSLWK